MRRDKDPVEPALPATVTFVTLVGSLVVIGWVVMFALLVKRW
jgi:hypothetical protein